MRRGGSPVEKRIGEEGVSMMKLLNRMTDEVQAVGRIAFGAAGWYDRGVRRLREGGFGVFPDDGRRVPARCRCGGGLTGRRGGS